MFIGVGVMMRSICSLLRKFNFCFVVDLQKFSALPETEQKIGLNRFGVPDRFLPFPVGN